MARGFISAEYQKFLQDFTLIVVAFALKKLNHQSHPLFNSLHQL